MKVNTRLIVVLLLVAGGVAPAARAQSYIRLVDFRNFTYAWDGEENDVPSSWHWIDTPVADKVEVTNGKYRFEDDGDADDGRGAVLSVVRVTYGDLIGNGDEEALVWLNYSTGGTANWDYLYVYRLTRGRLILMGRLKCGSRGSGGLVGVRVEGKVLVTDFADPDRLEGDCCSGGYIRVRYRWKRGRFVEVGKRVSGDMELREGPDGLKRYEEADLK
jgi:hypothetical protein